MQKKNDNFLDKIVKKDYNNELEKVLEKKYFDENVKSILLSILYKIENAYKDYEIVKQDVEKKDEFIQKIIDNIKENCETIKLVEPNSDESKIIGNKTFLVEKNKNRIICYPIERKLLYCISKISKNERIIKDDYAIIDKTLSDLLNTGNNINTVESMRDFNGYSWTTIPNEIESVRHNLIYQNLRMLVGNKFLTKWINSNDTNVDYMQQFKEKLTKNYGEELTDKLIEKLEKISFILDVEYDRDYKYEAKLMKKDIEEELKKILDSEEYIEKITKEKLELTKKIRQIDTIINNKKMLQEEYNKRNEKLPLKNKIFSMRVLAKIMEEERTKYLKELEKLNKFLNPKTYIAYKKELKEKYEYLKLLNSRSLRNEVSKLIFEFQLLFLKCFEIKLEKVKTKQQIIQLIYEFRYYCIMPYYEDISVYQVKQLLPKIESVQKKLILKAGKLKAINVFSKRENLNYAMLKNIFYVRIINIEELSIKITKEKDKFFVQLFDENAFEEKNEIIGIEDIKNKDLELRYNKKVNIFI